MLTEVVTGSSGVSIGVGGVSTDMSAVRKQQQGVGGGSYVRNAAVLGTLKILLFLQSELPSATQSTASKLLQQVFITPHRTYPHHHAHICIYFWHCIAGLKMIEELLHMLSSDRDPKVVIIRYVRHLPLISDVASYQYVSFLR